MGKRINKIARAAHIKTNTHGTSNEISFSVLDAAKQSLDGGKGVPSKKMPSLGFIPIFTLRRAKKPPATPVKEQGLLLSSGEFVSTESSGSSLPLLGKTGSQSTLLPDASTSSANSESLAAGSTGSSHNDAGVTCLPSGGGLPLSSNTLSALPDSTASQTWTTPVDEVARRKADRKRRKAAALTILTLACAVIVGAVGLFAYEAFQVQKDAKGRLVAQISEIAATDAALLEFDEMVVSVINDGWVQGLSSAGGSYRELEADLGDLTSVLTSAVSSIEAVQPELQDPYDQEAAIQAIVAAKARLSMLEAGQRIMEVAIGGQNAYTHADEAWVCLVEADSLIREAVQLVANTSVENVKRSMQLTEEALVSLREAPARFAAAEDELEGLDYSAYRTYVELRIESLEHALLSDQAYLDRDKETAARENEAYNELDAKAAQAAQEIGSDVKEIVDDLISPLIEDDAEFYASQRAHAATADTTLRGYLEDES